MNKYPIVDYFSFTVPMSCWLRSAIHNTNEGTRFECSRAERRLYNYLTSDHTATLTKSGGRFKVKLQSEKFGFTYLDGEEMNVSLIQISGRGCAYLRERNWLPQVLMDWHERATRLDIALDIETDVHPEAFARSRTNKRFKADAHKGSHTGYTWYVGEQKSDRHARVYRYADPLPRSDTLRVEYELHDQVAKHFTHLINELGVLEVAKSLGSTFGWNHQTYTLDAPSQKLPSTPRVESQGNTEMWFHKAVKPAIVKLAKAGKLDFLLDLYHYIGGIIQEYEVKGSTEHGTLAEKNWIADTQALLTPHLSADSKIPSALRDTTHAG